MMDKVLKIINEEMQKTNINYFYLYNDSEKVKYPYVTGEYTESSFAYENQMTKGDMLLECWHRGSDLELIATINKIKEHFAEFQAVRDGIGIAINYNSCGPRRTNDINLRKYEIHLDVVYWKG